MDGGPAAAAVATSGIRPGDPRYHPVPGKALRQAGVSPNREAATSRLASPQPVAASAASFPQLRDMGLTAARFETAELVIVMAAIGMGALAALIPALKVFRVDIAKTLADTR